MDVSFQMELEQCYLDLISSGYDPISEKRSRFFSIIVTCSAFGPICTLSSSPSACGLSGWLEVYEMDLSSCVQFCWSGELLFGVMQCGAMAPLCLRDVPFEYPYFTIVGDEL
ncbi:hypothetical protein PIB30_057631 [Stylosanthes scabra]|uniref:Uncharacterized protein n=1 Tax=Stylosanthes scabra TaxID=79078 RepID=A0ABU6UJ77_9FABA|nr:hypothetical protein [Stylosanthes scabra]